MSQLTQQRERRLEQQQQHQHWLASQQHQQQAEDAPEALQLDAEAWAWLQRRAEDSPVPRGGDSSDEDEDEALLAALAQQAAAFGTPLSLTASQKAAQAFGSQLQGPSQQWQAGGSQLVGSPGASQEEATLARAHAMQQRRLAAMQRECEAILACSQELGDEDGGGEQPDAVEQQELQHAREQQTLAQQQLGHRAELDNFAGTASAMQLDGQPGQQAAVAGSIEAGVWASGLQPGAVSPLPFSLSPAMQPPAALGLRQQDAVPGATAAAATAAAGGDIEDFGHPWAQQQQQQQQQRQQPVDEGAMQEGQEDEDAVYLQALQAYEAQQAQLAQQAQQPQADQQVQQQAPQQQQQQQQQGAAEQPHVVPQVDGAADSEIESAEEEGDGGGAGGNQESPEQQSQRSQPAHQSPEQQRRGRRRRPASREQPSPGSQRGALTWQSLSPPGKRPQRRPAPDEATAAPPPPLHQRRSQERRGGQQHAGSAPAQQQEQTQEPAAEDPEGGTQQNTAAAAPNPQLPAVLPRRPPSARSGAPLRAAGGMGSGGSQQRVAQYNVPGLRRKRTSQPPNQQLRQGSVEPPLSDAAGAAPAGPQGGSSAGEAEGEPDPGVGGGSAGQLGYKAVEPDEEQEEEEEELVNSKRQRQATQQQTAQQMVQQGAAQPAQAPSVGQAYVPPQRVREGSQALAEVLAVLQPADSPDPSGGSSGATSSAGDSEAQRSRSREGGPVGGSQAAGGRAASAHLSREQVMLGSQGLEEVPSMLQHPSEGEEDVSSAAPSSPGSSPEPAQPDAAAAAAPATENAAGGTAAAAAATAASPTQEAALGELFIPDSQPSPALALGRLHAGAQVAEPIGHAAAAGPASAAAVAAAAEAAVEEALQAAAAAVAAGAAARVAALAAAAPAGPAEGEEDASMLVIPDSQPSPTPPKRRRELQQQQTAGAAKPDAQVAAVASAGVAAAAAAAAGQEETQLGSQLPPKRSRSGWEQEAAAAGASPEQPPAPLQHSSPAAAMPLPSLKAAASSSFAVELSGFTTPAAGRAQHGQQAAEPDEAPRSTAASGQLHDPALHQALLDRQQEEEQQQARLLEERQQPDQDEQQPQGPTSEVAAAEAMQADEPQQPVQHAPLADAAAQDPSPAEAAAGDDAAAEAAAGDEAAMAIDEQQGAEGALPSQGAGVQPQRSGEWWRAEEGVAFGEDVSQLPLFDDGWVAGWHDEEGWMPSGSSDGEGGSPPGSQLAAEEQPEAEEGGEERPPAVWRYARPPPTQEELAASMWQHGLQPVVAQVAHYGRPQDAPAQPTVFAGQEFRIPTSAVEQLPEFQAAVAPCAMQHVQEQQAQHAELPGLLRGLPPAPGQPRQPRQLLVYVPAKPPPSRAATDAWLAARRSRRRGRQQWASSGGAAEYAMDPNTGQLLPAPGGGRAADQGRPGSADAEAELQGGTPDSILGDADLLGTPALSSLGSGGSRLGTPTSAVAATPATTAGTAAGDGRQGAQSTGRRKAGASHDSGTDSEEHGEEEEEAEVRPASPKYDESTFFFSNPFPSMRLTQRPASTQRRPPAAVGAGAGAQTEQQTPVGQRLARARGQAAGQDSTTQQPLPQQQRPSRLAAVAAAADEPHGQQPALIAGGSDGSPSSRAEQDQQQAQQAQRPASSLLKSVLKSALKVPRPSQLGGVSAAESSQEEQQRQGRPSSQGSEGSGSKRVSFAAAGAGGSSQEATPPVVQQVTPAATAVAAAVSPTQLTAAGTAPTAMETQRRRPGFVSQITPPSPGLVGGGSAGTPLSQAGFKQRRCVAGKGQQLTLLSLELHAESRGALLPDPRHDAVRAIVLAVADDDEEVPDAKYTCRVLLYDESLAGGPSQPQGGAASTEAAAPQVPVQPQAPQPQQSAYLQRWDAFDQAAQLAGVQPVQQQPAVQQPLPPYQLPARHQQQQQPQPPYRPPAQQQQPQPQQPAVQQAHRPEPVQPQPPPQHRPLAQPSPLQPGSPGDGLPSPAVAAGFPEGVPEPEIAVAPPAASTAVEALLSAQPGGSSQEGRTAGGQTPAGTWSTPRAAAGLRNPAAADALGDVQVDIYGSEAALLGALSAAVAAADPDILLGYEVQRASLGYAAERAAVLGLPSLLRALSRLPRTQGEKEEVGHAGADNPADEFAWQTASGLHCSGRIVLNVWRLMRTELKLTSYSFESCVAAVLQLRVPHVPQPQLHAWFAGGPGAGRWRCLSYWVHRARLNLALLDQLDLVGRTGEMARTFGIDFYSVLARGSQYRVESMMARLAHTQNYLLMHPGREQVARQPAMEALPLVMEPRSRLYTDPLVVLDFQSLYPSMIIAYNLCFSTCLGRPTHATAGARGDLLPKLGCTEFGLPPGTLAGALAPDKLVVAPNGVAFAPKEARPGVLPRLLQEILNTRIMVKGAMKRAPKSAKVLLRCLNARQFGLKLIANVTYGYTAAGFSGRMPMAELADAIVQSGRETLENAIRMVNGHPEWRAQVVYGDTDSMFVLLPGRSRAEAFRIGEEIAREVTAANPPPVMLKMEKVYDPCVLLSKKRYVGFAYESPSQATPTFDAKGIETVRRDGCPAVVKMMEGVLRLLFATKDLSQVKEYCERQFSKILAGRVSVADFVFAKEVRLGTYSTKTAHKPPAAEVALRAMVADPRAEPRFGERVPYVVVHGPPAARLIDVVVPPRALVESGGRLRLNAVYYITRAIIPALDRVLSLVGADIKAWYADMPRPSRMLPQKRPAASLPLLAASNAAVARHGLQGLPGSKPSTIDKYYLSRHCAVCDELTHATKPLCERCTAQPQLAAAVLAARWGRLERQYAHLVRLCAHCGGGGGRAAAEGAIVCDSLDCGVYFERRKVWYELQAVAALAQAGLALLDPGDP